MLAAAGDRRREGLRRRVDRRAHEAALRAQLRERRRVLAAAGADVLLFETLPCALEAKAIAELLSADFPEATAIVSFSCKDESCLNSGEPLAPALAADSLVLGTPLEEKLAAFGAASYPVVNSITDAGALADKFIEFIDAKVKPADASAVVNKAVDGLLAIPDGKVSEYAGVLKQVVYKGVSPSSCVSSCVEIKILLCVRHRRDACSMAWRCRFLTARRSQHGRTIAAK